MLKKHLEKISTYWETLSERDQRVLSAGIFALACFILYFFMWSPLTSARDNVRDELIKKSEIYRKMMVLDGELKNATPATHSSITADSPVVLLQQLQTLNQQYGLTKAVTTLKQSGDQAIEMHYDNVDFDRLIQLLTEVTKSASVHISQFSVTATKAPGLVNADVVVAFA